MTRSDSLAAAVRAWLALSVRLLARRRTLIDTANVFPVADRDTGSNVLRTLQSALRVAPGRSDAEDLQLLAAAMLRGARGSSGSIVAAMLAAVCSRPPATGPVPTPADVAANLAVAAAAARSAVARPVEGTILTVADAVAEAARRAADSAVRDGVGPEPGGAGWEEFARLLLVAAAEAVEGTRGRQPGGAGYVDAGAAAYAVIVEALALRLAPSLPADARPDLAALLAPVSPGVSATGTVACAAGVEVSDRRFELLALLAPDPSEEQGGRSGEATAESVRAAVAGLGELAADVVVTSFGNRVRVHLHLDEPGVGLAALDAAGEPVGVEVEPLLVAPSDVVHAARAEIARLAGHRRARPVAALAAAAVLDADLDPETNRAAVATTLAATRETALGVRSRPWRLSAPDCERLLARLEVGPLDLVTVVATPAVPDEVVTRLTAAATARDVGEVSVLRLDRAPVDDALLVVGATREVAAADGSAAVDRGGSQ